MYYRVVEHPILGTTIVKKYIKGEELNIPGRIFVQNITGAIFSLNLDYLEEVTEVEWITYKLEQM